MCTGESESSSSGEQLTEPDVVDSAFVEINDMADRAAFGADVVYDVMENYRGMNGFQIYDRDEDPKGEDATIYLLNDQQLNEVYDELNRNEIERA